MADPVQMLDRQLVRTLAHAQALTAALREAADDMEAVKSYVPGQLRVQIAKINRAIYRHGYAPTEEPTDG